MTGTGVNMNSNTVIVFDYSGTLSLDTVLFARPGTLTEHLAGSGLSRLGLHDPEIYWSRVVNPTWDVASTSRNGYARHLFSQARKIAAPEIPDREIVESVEGFIRRYMENSRIDPGWEPVLKKLSRDPAVTVVIATDHYAEATPFILKYLEELGLTGVKICDAAAGASLCVANSADVGAVKAQRIFWDTVKSCLSLERVERLLIVDDFGVNESDAGTYSDSEKVRGRKRSTIQLLQEVFDARVDVFEFIPGTSDHAAAGNDRLRRDFDSLVVKASAYIERFIRT